MGLDTSHDCWHGAYSAFMRWRQEIAFIAGLPPLDLMEGFYSPGDYNDIIKHARRGLGVEEAFQPIARSLPIRWNALRPDPALYFLLNHSDCDGEIPPEICEPLANRLEELLPLFPVGDGGGHIGNWRDKTATFIAGLRRAARRGETVDFH